MQMFPRFMSPINGIAAGFMLDGSFRYVSSLKVNPMVLRYKSSLMTVPRPWISDISSTSGGTSWVWHSMTLPPFSRAILSALLAAAISWKQKRHVSPKLDQLQCQSLTVQVVPFIDENTGRTQVRKQINVITKSPPCCVCLWVR